MHKTATHRSLDNREQNIVWDADSPLSMTVETREGDFTTRHGRFVGGVSDQVEILEVDTGAVRVMLLPTRGMSIWYLESNGTRFGWNSPIAGPVHPSQVPLFDPGGLGWLEGFDELVVRCGLESNGAPEHDTHGHLIYPLHGRIGNLPASSLAIEFDEASGRIEVIGEICESRLFFKRLRLRTRLRLKAGSADVELLDDVTNELAKPATMQLLYHINVGPPILGAGATLEAPVATLAPKDGLSASEMEQWNEFGGPQTDYSERVYFAQLRADENNQTTALLRNADAAEGLAVTFTVAGLPHFILWKNTAAEADGYVTGLEPATNFPNARSFESEQGRVVEIAAGETVSFRVSLHPLTTSEAVAATSKKIRSLQGDQPADIHAEPRPGWTPDA